MRSISLFVGMTGVLLAYQSAKAAPADDVLHRTTVLVTTHNGSGTGVIVKSDGTCADVLSARHITGNQPTATIRIHDGREFEAVVVKQASVSDLVLLRISGTSLPLPIVLSTAQPERDDIVYSAGWADTGRVTVCPQRAIGRMDSLQSTEFRGRFGRSGGALTNERGELVGICAGGSILRERAVYVDHATTTAFLNGTLSEDAVGFPAVSACLLAILWCIMYLVCYPIGTHINCENNRR